MKIVGLDQCDPEWITQRVGMCTASRVADVMAFSEKTNKPLAPRTRYLNEIVSESLTGRACDHYVTPAMERGLELEPLAAAAYEMAFDCELQAGGFWVHDRISRFGASPDRLLGEDGLVEFKAPTTAVHIGYLLGGVVPEDYKPQMVAEMACTGRQFVDFVSFDDRMPKDLRFFVRRLERDEKAISIMEQVVEQFLAEADGIISKLKQLAKGLS